MFKERNKAVPAVYLLLKKGGDILLMRRQGSGYFDGWYSVPAGHVDADELPLAGLVREVKEELGITIDPKDTRLVHTMYRTKHDETGDRVDLFFETEKWSGEPAIMEPHKCDDIRWFPLNALPENIVPCVKSAIQSVEKGVVYSEIDREHTVPNPSQ
jgi:8-oxo-dGTP diphosphatase